MTRAALLPLALLLLSSPASAQDNPADGPGGLRESAPPPSPPSEAAPPIYVAPPEAAPPEAAPPEYAPAPPPRRPPRPVGYVQQRRWGMFAVGVSVFGGAWVGNMISSLDAERYLGLIPVAGPFLLYDSRYGTGTNAVFILDGLAQIAGITVAIIGLTLPKRVPVWAVLPTTNGMAVMGRW